METRLRTLLEMSLTTLSGERLGISGMEMTEWVLVIELLSLSILEKVSETWEAWLSAEMERWCHQALDSVVVRRGRGKVVSGSRGEAGFWIG